MRNISTLGNPNPHDFRPGMLAIHLDLRRGRNKRQQKTLAYGHFGHDDPDFTWEIVEPLKWEKAQLTFDKLLSE